MATSRNATVLPSHSLSDIMGAHLRSAFKPLNKIALWCSGVFNCTPLMPRLASLERAWSPLFSRPTLKENVCRKWFVPTSNWKSRALPHLQRYVDKERSNSFCEESIHGVFGANISCSALRKLHFNFLSNLMGYDRGVSFPFDVEPNWIPFGSKSKGKLSPRSYPIQFEWKYSFLSAGHSRGPISQLAFLRKGPPASRNDGGPFEGPLWTTLGPYWDLRGVRNIGWRLIFCKEKAGKKKILKRLKIVIEE